MRFEFFGSSLLFLTLHKHYYIASFWSLMCYLPHFKFYFLSVYIFFNENIFEVTFLLLLKQSLFEYYSYMQKLGKQLIFFFIYHFL